MGNRQLEHSEVKTSDQKFPLVVICENIDSPENIGMVFRISESMGVERIFFTGTSVMPPNKKISKVSRSTDRFIPYSYVENSVELINNLKNEEYKVLALEITESSEVLSQSSFSKSNKYAIVIGSEKHGVNSETLNCVNRTLEIKLFGRNTSINVVSALGIALYEITKQIS